MAKPYVSSSPSTTPEEADSDTVDFLLQRAEVAHNFELTVKERLESKATTLLGFAGISLGLQSGLLKLSPVMLSLHVKRVSWVLQLISLALILASCFASFFAVKVSSYSSLEVSSICSFEELKRKKSIVAGKLLNAYLAAWDANRSLNRRKSRWLEMGYAMLLSGFAVLAIAILLIFGGLPQ